MLRGIPFSVLRWQAAAALQGLLFCLSANADLPREADISLSSIQLDDATSAKTPFGMQPELDDPNSDRPKFFVCNIDNTERLALVYYEGDTDYVISEFQVEQVETRYVSCAKSPMLIDHFTSGKGIALGMTRPQLVRLLGQPHHEHPQLDETVLIYRIDNKQDSGFLQNHGAPAYFGQYHFKQEKLVRFSFGFELP